MTVGFLIVVFGSAGKNRNLPSTTGFFATKPQVVEVLNKSLVCRSRFYPALLEPPVGSMRQIPEPTSMPPFSRRETTGKGVRHPGVLGMFRICRILPVFAPAAGRVHLYPRLDNGQNS